MLLSPKQVRQRIGRHSSIYRRNKRSSTKKILAQTTVGRALLILALSLGLLFLALFVSLQLTHQNTSVAQPPAPTFTAQAGPYTVTLSVTPNPPLANQLSQLTLRVTDASTGQPITDAGVQVQGTMEGMEMLTRALYADPQGNGVYVTSANLSMNGLWRLRVTITRLNSSSASTQFEITT